MRPPQHSECHFVTGFCIVWLCLQTDQRLLHSKVKNTFFQCTLSQVAHLFLFLHHLHFALIRARPGFIIFLNPLFLVISLSAERPYAREATMSSVTRMGGFAPCPILPMNSGQRSSLQVLLLSGVCQKSGVSVYVSSTEYQPPLSISKTVPFRQTLTFANFANRARGKIIVRKSFDPWKRRVVWARIIAAIPS